MNAADQASASTDAEGAGAKIAVPRLRQRLGLPAWRRWMRRDAKLEWQLHRQPGTVGFVQLQRTLHVCMLLGEQMMLMGAWLRGDWERDGHERDEGRWGRDSGDGKASGSEACVNM